MSYSYFLFVNLPFILLLSSPFFKLPPFLFEGYDGDHEIQQGKVKKRIDIASIYLQMILFQLNC